jgi:hypothetical protein
LPNPDLKKMAREKDSIDEAVQHDRDNISWSLFRAKQPEFFSEDGEKMTLNNWKEEKFAAIRHRLNVSESDWGKFVYCSLQKDQMEAETKAERQAQKKHAKECRRIRRMLNQQTNLERRISSADGTLMTENNMGEEKFNLIFSLVTEEKEKDFLTDCLFQAEVEEAARNEMLKKQSERAARHFCEFFDNLVLNED